MGTVCFLVKTERIDVEGQYKKSGQMQRCLRNAANLFQGLAGGVLQGEVDVYTDDTDPAAASLEVTIDFDTMTDSDTFTVGGVTFTAKSSGATGDQFNIETDDDTTAQNFADAINNSSNINEIIKASVSGAVVTLEARLKGEIGNFIVVSDSVSSGTPFSYSGSALSGGAGGPLNASETFSR